MVKLEKNGNYSREYSRTRAMLGLKFFRLEVLDRYKENPIYQIQDHPVSLSLSIKDKYFNDSKIDEDDKIGIQSLGYAYRKKDNLKVIVTYLPYLAGLPKRHQDYWASFEEKEDCILDQDFYDQEIKAEFTDRVNIFQAFLQELVEINKLCNLQGIPPLFSNSYDGEKHSSFTWPTKSTLNSYNGLISLLDKFISDNINKDFFARILKTKEEKLMENGKTQVIEKGTLRLLEEFLGKYFKFPDPGPKDKMLKQFKFIRTQRQKPAHKIEENDYHLDYDLKIKDLVTESYRSIRTLRLIFTNFSKAKSYIPPTWLQTGKIM